MTEERKKVEKFIVEIRIDGERKGYRRIKDHCLVCAVATVWNEFSDGLNLEKNRKLEIICIKEEEE